jgi:O-antigen/teichoic acid export membrane protein
LTDRAAPGDGRVENAAALRPHRRGSGIYLLGSFTSQACALIRYTVLARMLGPEQLGLAATLVLTAQFFESLTESGSDRLLIQDPDGDAPDVQRLVQLVFVGRGCLTAAALALIAAPVSLLLGGATLVPGFLLLALSPLIAGFLHLDMRRDQRFQDFRAEGWGMVASELAGIVVTIAGCMLLRTFMAVPFGLVVRSAVIVLTSHIRAGRTYEIGLARAFLPKLTAFALPLMANGLLLFGTGQGDRVLIGGRLGLVELGFYSATILLIFYPSAMIQRFLTTIGLPRIARDHANPDQQDHHIRELLGVIALIAMAMTIGFSVVAGPASRIMYGLKYRQSDVTIALVGVLQATRFMRTFPVVTALALGRSSVVLAGTVAALSGWPLALLGMATLGGLNGLITGFIMGEALALILATGLADRRHIGRNFSVILMFVAVCGLVLGWRVELETPSAIGLGGLTIASLVAAGWILPAQAATVRGFLAAIRAWAQMSRQRLGGWPGLKRGMPP